MTKRNECLKRAHGTLEQELLALTLLSKTIEKDLSKVIEVLKERKGRIIVTGIGKSGFIGMKISATLVSLGNPAVFLHPADALHGDTGVVSDGDVILAISFSGRTAEVLKIVKYLTKEFNVQVISITGSKDSPLAKLSHAHCSISVKDEGSPHGYAPMASTTASLVVGDMIASAITSPALFKKGQFARFHPGGGLALSMKTVGEVMSKGNDVPLVRDTQYLPDALKVMSGKFLGVTGVVNKKKELVGVITDGDVRRFLIHNSFDSKVPVTELMNTAPKSISVKATLKEALSLMEEYRITSLFVFNVHKRISGIIHIHSIIEGNLT